MTQQIQRLIARVDGLPLTIAPVSIIGAAAYPTNTGSKPATREAGPRRRATPCVRADWMSGRVPLEIERLVLAEESEIRRDLAAVCLM
jgi:hypothetical protein